MLYLQDDVTKIIVLETQNLEQLKQGRPLKTQDGTVVLAWTPDIVWLADKICDTGGDGAAIGRLIEEAAKRPEKGPRPHHPPHLRGLTNG